MATATFPNQYNTFVPSTDATDNMVVDFSRNPKKFKLPNYIQYVPVDKNVGVYTKMTVEMAGRVLDEDGADMSWADGNDAPDGKGNLEAFEMPTYRTQRFAPTFRMGEMAAEQASWEVVAQHSRHAAQRAMTLRSLRVITQMKAAGNYPTGHTSAVTAIPGVTGHLDLSTVARSDIKRTLDYGAEKIQLATLSAVQPEDMMVIISPTAARKLSVTAEFRDFMKQQASSPKLITSNLGPHNNYGMPEKIYDYNLVVEDTVRVSTRKGETTSKAFILDEDTMIMCSRPGELVGVEGAPTFSTWTLFLKEEMTVESKHDRDNRVHKGRCVDDHGVEMTAPISGFLFTDIMS